MRRLVALGPPGGCWCWTTPGCRRRALGRWGWPRSTGARWARWPTARWWSAPSTSRTCRRPAPPALAGQRPAVPARGVGGARARRRGGRTSPRRCTGRPSPSSGLTLVDRARTWGVPFAFVVADAGYGQAPRFLAGLETRGLPYACGVKRTFGLRLPDEVAAAARRPRRRTGAAPAPGAPAGAPVGRGDPAGRRPRRGVGGGHLAGGDEGRADQGVRRRASTAPPATRTSGRTGAASPTGGSPPARRAGCWASAPCPARRATPSGTSCGCRGGPWRRPWRAWSPWPTARWVVEQFYEDAKGACGLADYQGRRWDGCTATWPWSCSPTASWPPSATSRPAHPHPPGARRPPSAPPPPARGAPPPAPAADVSGHAPPRPPLALRRPRPLDQGYRSHPPVSHAVLSPLLTK